MRENDTLSDRSGLNELAELIPVDLSTLPWAARSEGKKVKTPYSRFKLTVIYLDQNTRTYYSWDYYYHHADKVKYRILDERQGLIKLMRYVRGQIEIDNLISAMIYVAVGHDTDTDNQVYNFTLYKYTRNKINNMKDYKFIEEGRTLQRKRPMKCLVETIVDLDLVNGIIR